MSLGGKGLVALSPQDGGKGLVHCFDDRFAAIILRELDTISDFVGYLEAKERFLAEGRRAAGLYGEEHLLAIYVHGGKKFPDANLLMVEGDLWSSLQRNPAYQRRVEADQVSYVWDDVIEHVAEHVLAGRMEFENSLSENEQVLRVMAREKRFERRMLAEGFLEFRERAERGEVRARIVPSPSGVTYVFFNPPPSFGRQERVDELRFRCFIARNDVPENHTVVGIGANVKPAPQGYAVDLALLSCPEWTEDHRLHAEGMREELGFFRNPLAIEQHFDEYPDP